MELNQNPQVNPPIAKLLRPFQEFAHRQSAGGIVLLACALFALAWANSPWAKIYFDLWHLPLTVSLGDFRLSHDLHFWVNDALMAVFFFVVGLEIKRELLAGELASLQQAALPIVAAIGGVLVPALIYAALNFGGPGAPGWGIPMATDIAFALGVLALLGDRVPLGLKVFLTALAIVDDIAAVLVIALFFTADISWGALGLSVLCLFIYLVLNRLGVRHPYPYALVGGVLWLAILGSGVHPTVAGVLGAFMIPSRTAIDPLKFLADSRCYLNHFEQASASERSILSDSEQQVAVESLEEGCEKVQPPLHRLEHALHPWVTFVIMPLFALANAGVAFTGDLAAAILSPVTLGVTLGLLLGKPLGITLASWLVVRFGWASLPEGVSWSHIHGAAWLAGIGFTMSFFMAGLSFSSPLHLTEAKLGIFTASLLAALVGSLLLTRAQPPPLSALDSSPK